MARMPHASRSARPAAARSSARQAGPDASRSAGASGRALAAPGPLPAVVQRQAGGAGLPAPLRLGLEQLSGLDLSGVQVRRQSAEPARLGALAFTRGDHIHLSPGQEHHLPHEAWHVVQQRQGRVQARGQVAGLPLNDDPALEREAEQMGAQALQLARAPGAAGAGKALPAPQQGRGGPLQRLAAPGGGVVQRAVGFEFETGDRIQQRKLGGLYWGELPKAKVVMNCGNDVKLTADRNSAGHSVVEMVLDPPVDEANGAQFAQAITTFTTVGNALAGLAAHVPVTLDQVAALNGPRDVRIVPSGGLLRGNPQMTLGVRFDRLASFFEHAGRDNIDPLDAHGVGKHALTNYKGQTRGSVQSATQVLNARPGGPWSEELRGLLTLLANYMKTGRQNPAHPIPKLNYAKLISGAFMARTDFGTLFDRLPPNEQAHFQAHPDEFADLALEVAGMQGSEGTRLFDRGVRRSNETNSLVHNVDHARAPFSPVGMRRGAWLQGMTTGQDSISSAQHPGKKATLEGLGALGDRTDRVANDPPPALGAHNRGRGVILELRQMADNKTPAEFGLTAQAVFDYIAALNA